MWFLCNKIVCSGVKLILLIGVFNWESVWTGVIFLDFVKVKPSNLWSCNRKFFCFWFFLWFSIPFRGLVWSSVWSWNKKKTIMSNELMLCLIEWLRMMCCTVIKFGYFFLAWMKFVFYFFKQCSCCCLDAVAHATEFCVIFRD